MNENRIKEIIQNYDELLKLTYNKLALMANIDIKYNINRIITINFFNDTVDIMYDCSSQGCYDTNYVEFPISYLSMADEDLAKTVIKEKENRLIEKKKKEDEQSKKQQQEEFEQYKKLKDKFENPS